MWVHLSNKDVTKVRVCHVLNATRYRNSGTFDQVRVGFEELRRTWSIQPHRTIDARSIE
jgi:hypothetical protein